MTVLPTGFPQALSRVEELHALLARRSQPAGAVRVRLDARPVARRSQPAGASGFASTLAQAQAAPASQLTGVAGGGGSALVPVAQAELGQTEQPPGSNDSARIAEYRTATAGSSVGPWCAYFLSFVARQAGTPLGERGQGFASVSAVYAWAQRTGRAEPAGYRPQPGDLTVWGAQHIGMVESVAPDGSMTTIEGNSSDAVSRRRYGPDGGGATGYVRMS